MLEKIVSGGQTGVDRAALDIAIALGIEYGGWCPKGRLDENGSLPRKYKNLTEVNAEFSNEKENYDARTKKNIRDSDGTLILLPSSKRIKDGTLLTIEVVSSSRKPYFIVDLSVDTSAIEGCIGWIADYDINTLNVAGPREAASS
ncbi:putative molybdenum carrier protein [Legionella feeleii]|uniref:Molybdenum carrier n=1 Tax=Legionella feeleii TaxID=453 RepID=A0A378KT32_9GAMM|nr:putative molybdenum carrier protein [Legionella feeleii]STX88253.1 Putative molybdenum carrier [Legionella feeleii]